MMNRKLLVRWYAVLLLTVVLVSAGCLQREGEGPPLQIDPAGPAPSGADLQAFLSAPDQVSLCDPIPMEFTVTNQGDRVLYLLKWYTPLEGVAGKIFRVTRDGQELDYLGILAMRGDPTPDQYVTLEPGGSASAAFDIAQYYDFSQPGTYQIAYQSPWISYLSEHPDNLGLTVDDLGPVEIPSEPVTIEVLPSEERDGCDPGSEEGALPPESAPPLVVTGLVRDVSPSLQVIWLVENGGFSSIALTENTALVGDGGEPLELVDVQPGWEVQATGRPGSEGVVIADEVIVHN